MRHKRASTHVHTHPYTHTHTHTHARTHTRTHTRARTHTLVRARTHLTRTRMWSRGAIVFRSLARAPPVCVGTSMPTIMERCCFVRSVERQGCAPTYRSLLRGIHGSTSFRESSSRSSISTVEPPPHSQIYTKTGDKGARAVLSLTPSRDPVTFHLIPSSHPWAVGRARRLFLTRK